MLDAAAVVTLLGHGADGDAVRISLARVPRLAGAGTAAVEAVAQVLADLYPGGEFCAGVQPDLLGEHIVERCLAQDQSLAWRIHG